MNNGTPGSLDDLDTLKASLEGMAVGLEQRGEKSAAHLVRVTIRQIQLLCGKTRDERDD